MKYPAKALTAAALALVLAFTLLSTAVFAEEPPTPDFTITADNHASMLEQLQQKFAEQMHLQNENFAIKIEGGVLGLYEIVEVGSEETDLVLKSTGEPDPVLHPEYLLDQFSRDPSNEYIYAVYGISENGTDGMSMDIYFSYYAPLPSSPDWIILAFTIEWDETKDQTNAVRNWAKEWVAENLEGVTDEFKKVEKIHDFIVENYSYDESLLIHTAHGMLTNGKGVCEAYSLLARALLDEAGIESRLVFVDAKATNDQGPDYHMWNLVRIGGFWYHMDVTWDDAGETAIYDYFLKGDETMEKDHSWNRSKVPDAPYDYGSAPSSAPGSSSHTGALSSAAAISSSAAAPSRHGVSVAPGISLPGGGGVSQPGVSAGSGPGHVSRDYGAYSEGGGYISRAPAAGESVSGSGSLRILWLALAIVFAAAAAAAVFIIIKRPKEDLP